jgi:poly(3-hydroxybutyrate) depolymerase
MLYQIYEMQHAVMLPFRLAAEAQKQFWQKAYPQWTDMPFGKETNASYGIFERMTRRYVKAPFGISSIQSGNDTVVVSEEVVWQKPFCRLLHFRKHSVDLAKQPKLLIVAPMSGHFATLLRSTIEGMLPEHDVFVTDWVDARDVAVADGGFDLDDYTDQLIEMLHHMGERAHVMAVCQPSVPVMVAVSLMSARNDRLVPKSMVLMGGPIDTRHNPTAVNLVALQKGESWFRRNVLMAVPAPYKGQGRKVYPGFLQLMGFVTMNSDRHIKAHQNLYRHMVDGDEKAAAKIEEFYDEYFTVMDLTAEFYMQTVERVFIKPRLAEGTYKHRGELIDPSVITETALLTVEGERDDITGPGQTEAAHGLVKNLAAEKKASHMQKGVGHYGVFSGRKFLSDVVPVISGFIQQHHA